MSKEYLKFLGIGSAFNTKLSNNAAYIKYDNSLLLIDCGELIFDQLIKKDLLNKDLKSINIFITHTHPDHCGSLGSLIFYCKYILGIQAKLFCVNDKITEMLTIQMVPNNIYDFIKLKFNIPVFIGNMEFRKSLKIIPIEVNHIKDNFIENPICTGFLFHIQETVFYYSGDCYEMPKSILDMINNNLIDYIYQDVSEIDFEGNPHMLLENLYLIIPKTFRKNVYCMHIDNTILNKLDLIEKYGFNVVTCNTDNINKKNTIAIYPGSFDPITKGHLNMIKKASEMFDKVIVSILVNEQKQPTFTMNQRLDLINKCIKNFDNVEVKTFSGLLVDYVKQENANIIIKGLRNVTDFEYELHMGMVNKQLNSYLETVLLIPDKEYQDMSSSVVRAIAKYKGDIDWIIPKEILSDIKDKYNY